MNNFGLKWYLFSGLRLKHQAGENADVTVLVRQGTVGSQPVFVDVDDDDADDVGDGDVGGESPQCLW